MLNLPNLVINHRKLLDPTEISCYIYDQSILPIMELFWYMRGIRWGVRWVERAIVEVTSCNANAPFLVHVVPSSILKVLSCLQDTVLLGSVG